MKKITTGTLMETNNGAPSGELGVDEALLK